MKLKIFGISITLYTGCQFFVYISNQYKLAMPNYWNRYGLMRNNAVREMFPTRYPVIRIGTVSQPAAVQLNKKFCCFFFFNNKAVYGTYTRNTVA